MAQHLLQNTRAISLRLSVQVLVRAPSLVAGLLHELGAIRKHVDAVDAHAEVLGREYGVH